MESLFDGRDDESCPGEKKDVLTRSAIREPVPPQEHSKGPIQSLGVESIGKGDSIEFNTTPFPIVQSRELSIRSF